MVDQVVRVVNQYGRDLGLNPSGGQSNLKVHPLKSTSTAEEGCRELIDCNHLN